MLSNNYKINIKSNLNMQIINQKDIKEIIEYQKKIFKSIIIQYNLFLEKLQDHKINILDIENIIELNNDIKILKNDIIDLNKNLGNIKLNKIKEAERKKFKENMNIFIPLLLAYNLNNYT